MVSCNPSPQEDGRDNFISPWDTINVHLPVAEHSKIGGCGATKSEICKSFSLFHVKFNYSIKNIFRAVSWHQKYIDI